LKRAGYRFGYRVGSRITEPVWREVYNGCKPIFIHFSNTFLSLLFLNKNKLSSLSYCSSFSDGENGEGSYEPRFRQGGRRGGWLAGRGGGATAPERKIFPFFLKKDFPTPFYLLIPILAPKFSKYEPITLDLMKYKSKNDLPLPYASFADLVRLDLLRPYVVLV